MNKKFFLIVVCLAMAMVACSITTTTGANAVQGSGRVANETRPVSMFDSVELKGSGNVDITFGSDPYVVVKADDNLLPLIMTSVVNGKLVIETKNNTNITTSNPIQISVVMPTLQNLVLSGSGNINMNDLQGQDVKISLPGSGTIDATGTADKLDLSLSGSGNINADGLKAGSVTASISGSGNVKVYATDSLNGKIAGSGTIHYAGNPAQVNKSVSGSGTITSK